MNDEHYKFALHEASHLIFNMLIRKANVEFPIPTYVKINTNHTAQQTAGNGGSIDGGWVTHMGNDEGTHQIENLKTKGIETVILQLAYLLSGYLSEDIYLDEKKKIKRVYTEQAENFGELKVKYIIGFSDYEKAHIIAAECLFGRSCGRKVKDEEAQILDFIQNKTALVLENEAVRQAIEFVAQALLKNNEIKGEYLTNLMQSIEKILKDVDFLKVLELDSILEECEKIRESLTKYES